MLFRRIHRHTHTDTQDRVRGVFGTRGSCGHGAEGRKRGTRKRKRLASCAASGASPGRRVPLRRLLLMERSCALRLGPGADPVAPGNRDDARGANRGTAIHLFNGIGRADAGGGRGRCGRRVASASLLAARGGALLARDAAPGSRGARRTGPTCPGGARRPDGSEFRGLSALLFHYCRHHTHTHT